MLILAFFNILLVTVLAILPSSTCWNPGLPRIHQNGNCRACSQFSQPFPKFMEKSLCIDLPKMWACVLSLVLPLPHVQNSAWICSSVLQRKAEEGRWEFEEEWSRHGMPEERWHHLQARSHRVCPLTFLHKCHGSSATGVALGQLLFIVPGVFLTCLRLLPGLRLAAYESCVLTAPFCIGMRLQLSICLLQVQNTLWSSVILPELSSSEHRACWKLTDMDSVCP